MGTLDEAFYKALTDRIESLKFDETQLNKFLDRIPEIVPDVISDSADSLRLYGIKDMRSRDFGKRGVGKARNKLRFEALADSLS